MPKNCSNSPDSWHTISRSTSLALGVAGAGIAIAIILFLHLWPPAVEHAPSTPVDLAGAIQR